MNMKPIKSIWFSALVLGGLTLVFGLSLNPSEVHAKNKGKYVKADGGGPPAWAPAHGYRRKFQYYPQQKVYYRADTKQYFWVDAGAVKVGTSLPSWIKISGSGTTAELDTDKPVLVNFK